MNLQKMMKQAQEMQSKFALVQERVGVEVMEGSAANGLVKAVVNGKGELKKLSLDKSVVDPEDIDTLEDLIIVAFTDAKNKIDAFAEGEMKKATSGLGLPAGMKLPF